MIYVVFMKLMFTCPPGLEDIVELELKEKFGSLDVVLKPLNIQGRVLADIPTSNINDVFSLRSIHHIRRHISIFNVSTSKDGLNEIYNTIYSMDLRDFLPPHASFRVTSERIGVHDYTSIDIQRVAGQAIVDKYGNKVDLEGFDVEFIVDVVHDKCIVEISISRESLHKRGYRVFEHPAALRPTIAYGMVRLSNPLEGNVFVDPMVGGGTILIEAALYMGSKLKLYGLDINERFIEGAKANAEAAGVSNIITLIKGDCTRLSDFICGIDRIVSNPPYGIRMEPRIGVKKLYSLFVSEAYKCMNYGGRLVTITLKEGIMRKALLTAGFNILHERYVLHGDLRTRIFIAEK